MKKNSKINCFTPKFTKKPEVGQIIFGEEEFIIGKKKKDSEIIEVGLTIEQCIVKEKKYEQIVSKGFLFEVPYMSETDVSIIDETRKDASWVIVEVEHKEKLKLIHSTLPESYMVRAKRLIDGKITENSETIEFYTCGSKSMIENIINKKFEVIGTMKIS
ncbi:MAG: hypothetical protein HPY57_14740 [Ignavibacteria bacterium]|nr:hypothetical protein [Ignavibacteria bacterium]